MEWKAESRKCEPDALLLYVDLSMLFWSLCVSLEDKALPWIFEVRHLHFAAHFRIYKAHDSFWCT